MRQEKYTIEQLQLMMEQYLENDAFRGFPEVLSESTYHIMRMKGKRIRPVMLLTASQAYGGSVEDALGPAAAVEVYHNFSLVHDDIIDKADIRRGVPTVHKVFGLNKAILTGDAMLLQSFVLLNRGPSAKLSQMLKVFSKATSEVIEGEQMDVNFEEMREVSKEDYMLMIKFKTSVLLAASMQIGAILGNASAEDQLNIYDFGLNLGLAFQIKDDYLDTYGDEKTFGKKIGGDILQNKKTYLLIQALENANEREKQAIFDLFDETDEVKKIKGMIALFDKLNVNEKTFEAMETLYQQALAALDKLSLDPKTKQSLYNLAELIYNRQH